MLWTEQQVGHHHLTLLHSQVQTSCLPYARQWQAICRMTLRDIENEQHGDRCPTLTIEMGPNIGLGHVRIVGIVLEDGLVLTIGESASGWWSHDVDKTELLHK
ncbi:unnamed protein product [Meganyctiphanes norvegica]|uniref:Uncharacterized protein n=1 Tax=Meganyctiphanes norvegica TaxID=48144 RepID=A0AAV2SIN0_MEGNR